MNDALILIIAVLLYGSVLAATTLLSQPLRVRLVTLCDDMLDEDRWSSEERAELEWMASSSSSSSIGVLIPIAAVFVLAQTAVGAKPKPFPQKLKRLTADPRYDQITGYYMLSVMACSPFAALLSLPFLLATGVLAAARGDRHLIRAVERPVLTASASLQPC